MHFGFTNEILKYSDHRHVSATYVANFGVVRVRILTYLLTPWSRVILEKLASLQLVKKFSTFYGTRRFLTALTSARHLSLSWASPIQSSYPNPTSWKSILILSSHLRLGLPSGVDRIIRKLIQNYMLGMHAIVSWSYLVYRFKGEDCVSMLGTSIMLTGQVRGSKQQPHQYFKHHDKIKFCLCWNIKICRQTKRTVTLRTC